jgi:hypothetical protein
MMQRFDLERFANAPCPFFYLFASLFFLPVVQLIHPALWSAVLLASLVGALGIAWFLRRDGYVRLSAVPALLAVLSLLGRRASG